MKKLFISTIALLLMSNSAYAGFFDNCFKAKDSTMEIAQQLRLEAHDMGWEVGKVKSLSVAAVVKSKKAIYPDGDIEVCLKEKKGNLDYKVQSSSKDADSALWRLLKKSKKGFF